MEINGRFGTKGLPRGGLAVGLRRLLPTASQPGHFWHEADIANHARRTVRLRDGLIESDDGGFGGIENLPVEDPLRADAVVY